MKHIFFPIVTLFFIAACSDGPRNTSNENTQTRDANYANAQPDSSTADAPAAFADTVNRCYLWAKNKDTIRMQLSQSSQAVKGHLTYNFYEKDDNDGVIDGYMDGDTLIAEYTFKSEGQVSIRQVMMKRETDGFVMGSGEMKEQNGRMIFTQRNKVKYNDTKLTLTNCNN